MSVKRYHPIVGNYVSIGDYLALERERDELRAMLFGCRAMLDSLRTGPDGTKYDFAQTRSGSRLNVRTVIDAIDAAMREGGDG